MAYEIFDDVAFYYLMTAVVALSLAPLAYMKLTSFYQWIRNGQSNNQSIDQRLAKLPPSVASKIAKAQKKQTLNQSLKRFLTPSNITFVLLSLALIVLISQVNQYNSQSFSTYDPYEILGLKSGADQQAIKKAYRSLALAYHPDKNTDDPAAAEQAFIKVTKG